MKKGIILGMLAAALLVAPGLARAAGLGISPTSIEVDNMLRGGRFEKEFVLSRSEAGADMGFTVVADGPLADWVTTNYGEEFIFPSGTQRFPFTVIIQVPEDAANGTYEDRIRLISQPVGSDRANGIGFSINAAIDASVTVGGEQVLRYEIDSLAIPSIEQGSPLNLVLGIVNEGNVQARPDRVRVELWDQFETMLLEEQEVADFSSSDPVPAFASDDFIVSVPYDQPIGQYWARVTAYQGEEVVYEDRAIFDIVEVGSLDKEGQLTNLMSSPPDPRKGDVVKVVGTFENTGAQAVVAYMNLDVSKGGRVIFSDTSPQRNVSPGMSKDLAVSFPASKSGTLVAEATVEFSGEATPPSTLEIRVRGMSMLMIVIIVIVALAIAAGIWFALSRGRMGGKRAKSPRKKAQKKKRSGGNKGKSSGSKKRKKSKK